MEESIVMIDNALFLLHFFVKMIQLLMKVIGFDKKINFNIIKLGGCL